MITETKPGRFTVTDDEGEAAPISAEWDDFFEGIGLTVMPAESHGPPRGWISLAMARQHGELLLKLAGDHSG
jgi:hypothetical protein